MRSPTQFVWSKLLPRSRDNRKQTYISLTLGTLIAVVKITVCPVNRTHLPFIIAVSSNYQPSKRKLLFMCLKTKLFKNMNINFPTHQFIRSVVDSFAVLNNKMLCLRSKSLLEA